MKIKELTDIITEILEKRKFNIKYLSIDDNNHNYFVNLIINDEEK